MYNITVKDQYSPAIKTVPANMSSVKISQFPDNGTSIVANREYTITISAISDQGISYPSDPVTISKLLEIIVFYLRFLYLCIFVYIYMVQLTSKFTTRVVFSRVLFKVLIKTRVPHTSEQIGREGLVHTSLDYEWESSRVSLREV